jgi:hypothetical protein
MVDSKRRRHAARHQTNRAQGGTRISQAPFDPPWRIGEFFGAEAAIDVLSQQTGGSGDGAAWDETLQCWTGDSRTLVASLGADRRFRKPVLNTENGYEYLRSHPTEKKQVHHTDKVRRSAWRIVCAGGYFAAGFHGTIGHSDVWNRIDAPNHYTFTVKDEGAAAQLATLHEFVTALLLAHAALQRRHGRRHGPCGFRESLSRLLSAWRNGHVRSLRD